MYALICVYCVYVFVLCECVTVTLSNMQNEKQNYQRSKQCLILVPDLALH